LVDGSGWLEGNSLSGLDSGSQARDYFLLGTLGGLALGLLGLAEGVEWEEDLLGAERLDALDVQVKGFLIVNKLSHKITITRTQKNKVKTYLVLVLASVVNGNSK
jgi:hypothetical protein